MRSTAVGRVRKRYSLVYSARGNVTESTNSTIHPSTCTQPHAQPLPTVQTRMLLLSSSQQDPERTETHAAHLRIAQRRAARHGAAQLAAGVLRRGAAAKAGRCRRRALTVGEQRRGVESTCFGVTDSRCRVELDRWTWHVAVRCSKYSNPGSEFAELPDVAGGRRVRLTCARGSGGGGPDEVLAAAVNGERTHEEAAALVHAALGSDQLHAG